MLLETDKGFNEKGTTQIFKNLELSPLVELTGIEPAVQTYSSKAFYMLISLLFVGDEQETNKPIHHLAGWS